MGLIGGIIGGIGSAVDGIIGGKATAKAAQRNARIIRDAEQRNQAWYDREYNSDFLQRSDAQSAISKARDLLSDRYAQSRGAAAVSGATDESVAMQKAANNDAIADIVEKPLNFDPFGHARFAHLFVLYD